MVRKVTRRRFCGQSALSAAAFWVSGLPAKARSSSPNERLNVGVIGCGGKGYSDMLGCASENIVALCDVDDERAAKGFDKQPNARRYNDFRRMLDKETSLDAVVVSTPDHVHAAASAMAMKLGKHVYCQKPLTHSVREARVVAALAASSRVATQMGNQYHSDPNLRRVVEVLRAGAIGPAREVHVWTDRPGTWWTQPVDRPKETPPVPQHLKWNLWLGPAPARPYNEIYLPFKWRAWWDFGTGALGDMACHLVDIPYWGLDLGAPTTVEAQIPELYPETGPAWEIITYKFPARNGRPLVTLVWYDGGKKPPESLADGQPLPGNGIIVIGDKGTLYVPHGLGKGMKLLPEEAFADYTFPEPTLPRSPGHYKEWIQACKGGPAALSRFEVSAPFTEALLLGNVAVRLGRKIEWDAQNMRIKGAPEADEFLHREYRTGWTL